MADTPSEPTPSLTTDAPAIAGASVGSSATTTDKDITGAPVAQRRVTLLVSSLALFIISVDTLILNVGLPSIARDAGATAAQLQWLVDAYILLFAGLLLIGGALGDNFGRRRALLVGLVLFGSASAVGSVVDTAGALIGVRAAMGVAAALIMPATLSLVTVAYPPEERGKAIATWSAAGALAVAVGPLVGGALLEYLDWHSLFAFNVPLVVVAVAVGARRLGESRGTRVPLDMLGAALAVVGVTTLLYGLIEGPVHGWDDNAVFLALTTAVLALISFVVQERSTAHPLLDVRLFTNPKFSAASVAITLLFFSLTGVTFFLTQYLQFVAGYGPFRAGAALLPAALAIGVGAPVGIKLSKGLGARWAIAAGMLLVACALLVFSAVEVSSSYVPCLIALVLMGAGLGVSTAPATESIMSAVPQDNAGVGSAVNDTTRELGSALGVAVLGSVLSIAYGNRMAGHLDSLNERDAAVAADGVGGALAVAAQLPGDAATSLINTAHTAFVDGMSLAAIVGANFVLIGALVAVWYLPARDHEDPSRATTGTTDGLDVTESDNVHRNGTGTRTPSVLAENPAGTPGGSR